VLSVFHTGGYSFGVRRLVLCLNFARCAFSRSPVLTAQSHEDALPSKKPEFAVEALLPGPTSAV